MRELRHQVVRRLPLQPLHQSTDRHLRRYRYEQVDVVLRYVPLHDPHLMLRTDVSDQIPRPGRHLSL